MPTFSDDGVAVTVTSTGLIISTAQGAPISVTIPGISSLGINPSNTNTFHSYVENSFVLPRWSISDPGIIWRNLLEAPAPSLFGSSVPVTTGSQSSVYGLPWTVTHYVDAQNWIVVNITNEGHIFHPGVSIRHLRLVGDNYYITTIGYGNGDAGFLNEVISEAPMISVWDANVESIANESRFEDLIQRGISFLRDHVLPGVIGARTEASPLVLDLDGDGIELSALGENGSVFWDIDSDGFREASAWVLSDDALLVLDRNRDGIINNHSELFGDRATDGFSVLASFDDNGDGVIDIDDAVFMDLEIWRDRNGDAVSQADELANLVVSGISSISLDAADTNQTIAGNRVTHLASFTRADGSTGRIVDVWFQYDNVQTIGDPNFVPSPEIAGLPSLRGYGILADLRIAVSQDPGLRAVLQSLADAPLATLLNPSFNLEAKFRTLLWQWAGVEDEDADGRGRYIDGRDLAFLEVLTDLPFDQRGSPDPYVEAAATLRNAMEKAHDAMLFRFFAQTHPDSFITGIQHYQPLLDEVVGTFAINFTRLDALVDGWNATGTELAEGWGTILRIIDGAIGIENLTPGVRASLDARIAASDPSHELGLDEVLGRIFPAEGLGLNGTTGPDTINGGTGNDSLDGGSGNDQLSGRAGHDSLFGGGNDDILAGESGDDTLQGGAGNDIYVYSTGLDTIRETSGADTLRFGAGITLTSLRVKISPTNEQDAHIYVNGILSLIVENMFTGFGAIETFRFANGSQFNSGSLIAVRNGTTGNDVMTGSDAAIFPHDFLNGGNGNDRLTGGLGDDRLFGGTGSDTYVVTAGHDRIEDQSGALDRIQFGSGFTLAAARLVRSDDDLVISFSGVAAVTIRDQFDGSGAIEQLLFQGGASLDLLAHRYRLDGTGGRDTLRGIDTGAGGDIIAGLGGDDRLYGYGGNDQLDGGDGNDYLEGGYGNDRYVRSTGQDVVRDGGGGVDSIAFGSVAPSRIGYIQSGLDLILTVDGVEALRIDDQFTERGQIETLTFAGGQTVNLLARSYVVNGDSSSEELYGLRFGASPTDEIHGFDGDDRIRGYGGNDLLDGGAGNDELFGDGGNDRYHVGTGHNYVSDAGLASEKDDRLYLPAGILPAGVTLTRRDDGDLVVSWATGSVVIDRAYEEAYAIEKLVFASGASWDLPARPAHTVGSNADDALDGNAEELGSDKDTIFGLLGNDRLSGLGGADTLDGGGGDDLLIGGGGADTYRVGEGADFIDEFGLTADGPDRIFLPSTLTPAAVTLSRRGDGDLVLSWAGGSVRIDNGLDARSAVEELHFANGVVWQLTSRTMVSVGSGEAEWIDGNLEELGLRDDHLQGLAGDDVLSGFGGADRLDGGRGDDELYGAAGGDVYVVGYGWDYVADAGIAGDAADVLRIGRSDIVRSDLSFARLSDGNVRISWDNGLEGVILYRGLTGNNAIEYVELANGTRFLLSAQSFQTVTLPTGVTRHGDAAANSLVGGAGDDWLNGDDGNDILNGGLGNDELYGERGADVYRVGSGHDFLSDAGSAADAADRVELLADIARSALSFIRLDDGDLLVRWAFGSFRIDNAFDPGRAIEILRLKDGTSVDLRTVAFVTEGTTGAESLQGNLEELGSRNDTIRAFDGDDELYGYDGNDVLDGGLGNDTMFGERGGDRYIVGGHDWIVDSGAAGDAADIILFPAGVRLVDLTLTRTPDDQLLVTWAGGSVGIDDAFSALRHIETFQFSDGAKATVGGLAFTTKGTHESETIRGNEEAFGSRKDTIHGLDGDDRLYGLDGADRLIGGGGNDFMIGGAGADTYVVGEGADYIEDAGAAGDGADTIVLPAALLPQDVQVFRLGDGDLWLNWSTGSVRIQEAFEPENAVEQIRFGNGTIWQVAQLALETRGSGEHEILYGNRAALGSHNDTIRGLDGNDRLFGFDGADVLDGGAGDDELEGGAGGDIYLATAGHDLFDEGWSGSGLDRVRFPSNVAIDEIGFLRHPDQSLELVWSGGTVLLADHFRGGGFAFESVQVGALPPIAISALLDLTLPAGSIVRNGGDVANTLLGKGGADTLRGLGANDMLLGGDGNDRLEGGLGDDLLYGGKGHDRLDGGAGIDTMRGGGGNDTYIVDNVGDRAIETAAGGGIDLVQSSVSFTLGDRVENLTLTGAAAVNGTGNALANILTGNGAANLLRGGGGADTLRGNVGADRFQFDTKAGATNIDHVVDFAPGTDRIVLDNAVFAGLAAGALAASAFKVGSAASSGGHRIIYNGATGALLFDADGIGAAAAIQFAVLDNRPATLSASDFLVI